MDLSKYEVMEQFAEGGFGEIFYVKKGKEIYALKKIKYRGKLENDPYILGEIQSLSTLKHQHIIKLHDVIITSREVNIIMEYAHGGNLEQYVQGNGILSENVINDLFRQILLGANYCHKKCIAHRDLTPSNILLTGRGMVKLADFGLAVKAREKGKIILCYDYLGNNSYLSPEVLRKEPYDPLLSDVWSLGITLYFLVAGKEPYAGSMEDVLHQQKSGIKFQKNKDNLLSHRFETMMINILQFIPEDRPSVDSIILNVMTTRSLDDAETKMLSNGAKGFEEQDSCDEMFSSRQV